MTKSAQHHFVTSAYLDAFLAEKATLLYVYTRNRENYFRAQPDKIARIHNYYSLRQPDGSVDNKVEELLERNVEGPGIHELRKLDTGRYNIPADARMRVAFLMAIQEYRVPWMRENMEKMMRDVQGHVMGSMLGFPGYLERFIAETQESEGRDITVTADQIREAVRTNKLVLRENPGSSMWAMGAVAEQITEIYFGMRWTILESRTTPFLTSDCPVHRFYDPTDRNTPYVGLADPRLQVRFPISRTRMLVLDHDLKRMEIYEKLIAQGRLRQAKRRKTAASQILRRQVEATEVAQLNAHTISMASRIVISPDEMADIPTLFRGECRNIRQRVDALPGGLIRMSTEYPPRESLG